MKRSFVYWMLSVVLAVGMTAGGAWAQRSSSSPARVGGNPKSINRSSSTGDEASRATMRVTDRRAPAEDPSPNVRGGKGSTAQIYGEPRGGDDRGVEHRDGPDYSSPRRYYPRPWHRWDRGDYDGYHCYGWWSQPYVVVVGDSGVVSSSSATYEVSEPGEPVWVEGHWEKVAREDVIEGEFVEVYYPAVFERQEDGSLHQLEKERTVKEPKVRIILDKVWIEGRWEPQAPADQPKTE